jgi:hypothetical protein
VSSQGAHGGQVDLQTIRQPPVLLSLSPASSPLPFDPTDPAACATSGRAVAGAVGTPSVIEIPAGKACVIQTDAGGKRMTVFTIGAGDRGLTVRCEFQRPGDANACEPLVRAIALAN